MFAPFEELSALLLTLALYELLIRRINALRWLFGMKPRPFFTILIAVPHAVERVRFSLKWVRSRCRRSRPSPSVEADIEHF